MENPNKLKNLELYKKLYKNYRPSESSIKLFSAVKYFPLIGVSSSGRDSLMTYLTNKYPIFFDLITTTTRKPRINNGVLERDGVEYHFVQEEQFLEKIENGEMLEWAVIHNQQLSGSDIKNIQEAAKLNKVIINDVTPDGAIKFGQYSKNVHPIFIIPPSFSEWQRRMQARGLLSPEEMSNRMASARHEISESLKLNDTYFVVNDNLEAAGGEIYQYIIEINSDAESTKNDSKAREVAEEVLKALESN
jgi:guanylate kinase